MEIAPERKPTLYEVIERLLYGLQDLRVLLRAEEVTLEDARKQTQLLLEEARVGAMEAESPIDFYGTPQVIEEAERLLNDDEEDM